MPFFNLLIKERYDDDHDDDDHDHDDDDHDHDDDDHDHDDDDHDHDDDDHDHDEVQRIQIPGFKGKKNPLKFASLPTSSLVTHLVAAPN